MRVPAQVKTTLKHFRFFNDFFSFVSSYPECISIWRFVLYRFFPSHLSRVYWPTHRNSEVRGRVIIGKGARVGHRPGCVIQGRGKVFIGDYVGIGPNCMIISGNHDVYNQREVVRKETIIGDYCWLASSSIVLAGVVLGPRTIVGAGSVVTKSFPQGYCVIAGNPARIVRLLDKEKFVKESHTIEYYGYIRSDKFHKYKERCLSHISFDYNLSLVTDNKEFTSSK